VIDLSLVALGCVGGALPDAIRIVRNRHNPLVPAYLASVNFWLGVLLLVGLGGLSAWLGGASEAREALAHGFGAPEIISRLAGNIGPEAQVRGRTGRTLSGVLEWWSK
jgi:hypothetical protein